MAFNNIPASSLSRFSIGEVQDLVGVTDFYNAGSSKWLRSATATASSNLTTATKTNLAAAGTSTNQTVLVQGTTSLSLNAYGCYASYPVQRISASNISVVPSAYLGTTAVGVGVITSAGFQMVSTGQTSNKTNSGTQGANGVVASNDTTIFSYCFTSATALSAASTTNGTTWTAGTVTGIPVFATSSATQAHASAVGGASYTVAAVTGWKRTQLGGNTQFAVFWCGARFVLIGPAATNYMVSLSTDGLAWGGDNTTAVIGATAQAKSADIQFYRNGNNCYLNVGTSYRFSTDGGVTWAASTFAGAPDPTNYYLQSNETTPAKLIIQTSAGATTAYYSADSGATWSANRAFPTTPNGGVYYRGSTLVFSDASGTNRVSTDDGVTWVAPAFPLGVLNTDVRFFADANRFYGGVIGQAQLLTSTDAVTWTLVTLPQNYSIGIVTTQRGNGILPFDSNTVMLLGYSDDTAFNQCLFTLDGGVTWTGGQYTTTNLGSGWAVGHAFMTPDGGGFGFAWGTDSLITASSSVVIKSDLTTGGAFYRTGSSIIAPTRTNAKAFVRVA